MQQAPAACIRGIEEIMFCGNSQECAILFNHGQPADFALPHEQEGIKKGCGQMDYGWVSGHPGTYEHGNTLKI